MKTLDFVNKHIKLNNSQKIKFIELFKEDFVERYVKTHHFFINKPDPKKVRHINFNDGSEIKYLKDGDNIKVFHENIKEIKKPKHTLIDKLLCFLIFLPAGFMGTICIQQFIKYIIYHYTNNAKFNNLSYMIIFIWITLFLTIIFSSNSLKNMNK